LNFLVDTSVISETRKPSPLIQVARWWGQYPLSRMHLSVVTIHELRYGIEIAPSGAKRSGLEQWLNGYLLPQFADRILPVDLAIAESCAQLIAASKKAGHTAEFADGLIAATAKVHGLTLATLNVKHFKPFHAKLANM
jgi:predicted nucleic acid-binding protein